MISVSNCEIHKAETKSSSGYFSWEIYDGGFALSSVDFSRSKRTRELRSVSLISWRVSMVNKEKIEGDGRNCENGI